MLHLNFNIRIQLTQFSTLTNVLNYVCGTSVKCPSAKSESVNYQCIINKMAPKIGHRSGLERAVASSFDR
jgi:hypothetical protein